MINRLVTALRDLSQGRFLRDTAILQSGQFALILLQAATNYVIVRSLGGTQYGTYTLIIYLAALIGLLDVSGSARLSLTQLAKATAAENKPDVVDILAYFLKINVLINVPMVVIFFVLGPSISTLYDGHPDIGEWARWLVILELTDLPTGFLSIVYQSRREMRRLVSYETSKIFVVSVMAIASQLLGFGINGLVFSTLSVSVVYGAISLYRYFQLAKNDALYPTWQTIFHQIPRARFNPRLRLGFYIAIEKNLGNLIDYLIILLLGLLGRTFLGNFRVALQIVTLPQPLITGLSRNLDVVIPSSAAAGKETLRKMFINTTLYSGLIWAFVTIGIAAAAPFVIYLLFPNYHDALPLIYPLLLQSLSVGFGVTTGSTLRTLNILGYSIIMQVMFVFVMLPLGFLAITLWSGYGGALFFGFRELFQTLVGIAFIWYWLNRKKVVV